MLVLLPSAFDLKGKRLCRRYRYLSRSADGSTNQNLINNHAVTKDLLSSVVSALSNHHCISNITYKTP